MSTPASENQTEGLRPCAVSSAQSPLITELILSPAEKGPPRAPEYARHRNWNWPSNCSRANVMIPCDLL